MQEYFKSIGLPTSLKEFGAKEDDIPLLVKNCPKFNNEKAVACPMTEQDIAEIYRNSMQ